MKHQIDCCVEATQPLLQKILEVKDRPFGFDPYQFKVGIHPIISNFVYNREKEVEENRKFETLIKLARVLDDGNICKVIEALNYSLK